MTSSEFTPEFRTRFWSKVHIGNLFDCWTWTAYISTNGYGQIGLGEKLIYAHRAAYIMENGPIPDRLFICHHCDNRACVNPSHLFSGTQQDNMSDASAKGRTASGGKGGWITKPESRPRGTNHWYCKLTPEHIPQIRALIAEGLDNQKIAIRFGVARATIHAIKAGKTWTHIT